MPNFQDEQSLGRPIYLIDDPVVADTIFEAPAPFLSLQCLVAQQSRVFAHPVQFVQNTHLNGKIKALYVCLRFRHQDDLKGAHSPT
jgi:hypothetical protein